MALLIPDETLAAAGLTEADAKVEIACRLFDAGRLTVGHASRFAGLAEDAFEDALRVRNIPRYRYTEEMLLEDVEGLKKLGRW